MSECRPCDSPACALNGTLSYRGAPLKREVAFRSDVDQRAGDGERAVARRSRSGSGFRLIAIKAHGARTFDCGAIVAAQSVLPISSRSRSSDTAGRKLTEHGVTVRARNRQRLSLDGGSDEALYLVRRGVFFVKTMAPPGRSQILTILFPGDLIWPRALPSIPHASLVAASAGAEVLRLRAAAVMPLAEADAGVATFIAERMVGLAARMAQRGIMIAGFTGEERVAALLAELGDRIGTPVGAGVAFDMPLTRSDIADHLALNSDTVSRIVSRLRARGAISMTGRHRLFCRDVAALRQWCEVDRPPEERDGAGQL